MKLSLRDVAADFGLPAAMLYDSSRNIEKRPSNISV